MLYYLLKVALSAAIVVLISEIARRNPTFAALIASLPLTSLLAFVWMWHEGAAAEEIGHLSGQIFWLVLPSLALFLVLPYMIRLGVGLWISMGIGIAATMASYGVMLVILRRFGASA